MTGIYVNLKRFDIPLESGGICPEEDPAGWIENVLQETADTLDVLPSDLEMTFLLPESLIVTASKKIQSMPSYRKRRLSIGCQSVFREDVETGGNFGAFTGNLPASAAVASGARWAMVGHSEERRDKIGQMALYDPDINESPDSMRKAQECTSEIINREVICALESGLDVLFCTGESAEERGEGTFEDQKPRIRNALRLQVEKGLKGVTPYLENRRIVIGYEPIWAIGPGKTPPGRDYIQFVAEYIKTVVEEIYAFVPDVVYGGGLKKENAAEIASVDSIDGGLIALTKFVPPIGFSPTELKTILSEYKSSGT